MHDLALRPWHVIELCAGAGGLGLGIELAVPGARGVAYVEREAAAASQLVHRMETGDLAPAPVWSDLATFDARPWRGRVHCVSSGDPCQPNSVAGKRGGAGDERFLIDQVLRIVRECRPLRVFRENVTGNAAGQLAAIVGPLEGMGYRVAAGIFSSAETGNSHRRERLFIMADDARVARELFPGQWGSDERAGDAGGACRSLADATGGGRDARRENHPSCQQPIHGSGWPPFAGYGSCHLVDAISARRAPAGPGPVLDASPQPMQGGCQLDDTAGDRRGKSFIAPTENRACARPVAAGQLARGSEGSGCTVADPDGAELEGQLAGLCDAAGWQEQDGHPQLRGRAGLRPLVIPGPTDRRWIDVLDRWPELQPALSEAEAQSHLRRGFDAVADRVDRLRILGNGVDPVAAAYAWICLDALQRQGRAGDIMTIAA